MSVKAPSEKNFRRSRVKPAKRKGGRAWISWRGARAVVGAALVVYAGYRAVDLVAGASTLQVRRIAVRATSGSRPARCRRWWTACGARTS